MVERDEDDRRSSERTCIVTRQTASPDQLIRFVRGPDGSVVPDLRRKLPGRGVWLTPSRSVVETAVKKKAFARAFKAEVKTAATLADDVEWLIERGARESLSLANKAGQVVAGFSKVEEAVGRGQCQAILQASDAAPDGVRKIGQILRRMQELNGIELGVLASLSSDDLGLALGRPHVIHAALLDGSAGRACLERLKLLDAYRASTPLTAAIDGLSD